MLLLRNCKPGKAMRIAACLLLFTGPACAAPIATTQGRVDGITKGGVQEFLGIPYAAPPVGALRWMPPQPAATWHGVRQAKAFGPTCAQVTTLGPFAGPPNSNEDCLYLNVFTPRRESETAGAGVDSWRRLCRWRVQRL